MTVVATRLAGATAQQLIRLDKIAEHLNLSCDPDDEEFVEMARRAVLRKIRKIARKSDPQTGEQLLAAIASHFKVRFESVQSARDIESLQSHYVKARGELGFAMLDEDLSDPNIDALLFQLENPKSDSEEYVAILNSQRNRLREYWNKGHELVHRIAEPPQLILPFLQRHPAERQSPVERLVDDIAGSLAFYRPLFEPCVRRFADADLTLTTIREIRNSFAPSASLLAAANATVKHWGCPAIVLVGKFRGRKRGNVYTEIDQALRVDLHAANSLAMEIGLSTFPNMRVPSSSPAWAAFSQETELTDEEDLSDWVTSRGKSLPDFRVLTSAARFGKRTYAVLSLHE